MRIEDVDVAVVGAGAAGLMAAIWAARTNPQLQVCLLEGSEPSGAKILISGGGRCNVTHYVVSAASFAGSTKPAIQKVLRKFDVESTIRFFQELGVMLKREETGKLFPTSDKAQTVLTALWNAAQDAGVDIRYPRRVERIEQEDNAFQISGEWGRIHSRNVVLATGGKSVPKTGSDGHGYAMAKSLGHSITPHLDPALVPLLLESDHFLLSLSGVSVEGAAVVRSSTGKNLVRFDGPILFTHFGLSGPIIMDISRYWIAEKRKDPGVWLSLTLIAGKSSDEMDRYLREAKNKTVLSVLREFLPERLARACCEQTGIDPSRQSFQLPRDQRKAIAAMVTDTRVPVTATRGFNYAEVTAGGIPLAEIHLDTMESRKTPGLFLCGEICDVDGRIGGYNFQWAWSSGYLAGIGAGKTQAIDKD